MDEWWIDRLITSWMNGGWMNGWMNGGWMNGQMIEWMDGWMDEWMDEWRTDEWRTDEWIDGQMDESINGWIDRWMNGGQRYRDADIYKSPSLFFLLHQTRYIYHGLFDVLSQEVKIYLLCEQLWQLLGHQQGLKN